MSRKEGSGVIDQADKISGSVFAECISKDVEVPAIEHERAADISRIVEPICVIYIVDDFEFGYRWWVDGMMVATGAY